MILKLYKQVGLQGGNILRNIIILVYYIWKSKPTNIYFIFDSFDVYSGNYPSRDKEVHFVQLSPKHNSLW